MSEGAKVKINETEWQLGFDDGYKNARDNSVVDEYSYSAGWIEGEAKRLSEIKEEVYSLVLH